MVSCYVILVSSFKGEDEFRITRYFSELKSLGASLKAKFENGAKKMASD